MKDECLICGAPLEYLDSGVEMTCAICHKKEESKTRCVAGHYVCDTCHTGGIDTIVGVCLTERSKDPHAVLERLFALPFCHMHGPEHHVLVGASLLTAYKNAGGEIDLAAALADMQARGQKVPGGACGFWGACGAAISAGMFLSIVTGATPLSGREWGLANQMTGRALQRIGEVGGPRCCKRNAFLAITEAVAFVRENLGVEMDTPHILCRHSEKNNQCLGRRCPFHAPEKKKVAFICVHNSCRSQIAEALGKHLAGDRFAFYSAGTETKPHINPDAVRLLKELYGIDMEQTQYSKTVEAIPTPDIAISMGCDVGCPYIGRAFDADWGLPDPTGQSDAVFRDVIRQIAEKIEEL